MFLLHRQYNSNPAYKAVQKTLSGMGAGDAVSGYFQKFFLSSKEELSDDYFNAIDNMRGVLITAANSNESGQSLLAELINDLSPEFMADVQRKCPGVKLSASADYTPRRKKKK